MVCPVPPRPGWARELPSRASRLLRWALHCPQADLSSLAEIENSLAVFCMATYGEGDPTDNAQDFYDWLQEADADLSGVKYAVSPPSPPNPGVHVAAPTPGPRTRGQRPVSRSSLPAGKGPDAAPQAEPDGDDTVLSWPPCLG